MQISSDSKRLLEQVWDGLRNVQDPEIRLDIVNLGLIYDVRLEEKQSNSFKVIIEMTLTSPTCPMAPYIFQNIHECIEFLDGVSEVDIHLVWNPPWSKDKISEEGKMELGLV